MDSKGRRTDIVRSGGLYRWEVKTLDLEAPSQAYTVGSAELWHRRLAHRSLDVIQDKESVGIEMKEGAHVDGAKCSSV